MEPNNLKPLNIRSILNHYGIKPSKGLGQNFIVDEKILKEIVNLAGIDSMDSVLEIGPGFGSLTRHLAIAAKRVVAVELDRKLFPALEDILQPFKNIQLVQGDILRIPPSDLIKDGKYQVVANIPYYITSNLIRHLLESDSKPERIVITVQKEIAERICSENKGNLLSISIRVFGEPSILMDIPAKAFYPIPNVDSTVIQIELSKFPFVNNSDIDDFFRIVKSGFSQKRKTLRNSLSSGLQLPTEDVEFILTSSGIDPMRRAETLDLEEWKKLMDGCRDHKSR
jgi:16S rRNA (adenine1518-N6/adenine1519-N6)-dimethyltransferase